MPMKLLLLKVKEAFWTAP